MGKMLLGLAAAIAVAAFASPAAAGTPEEAFVGVPSSKGAVGTFGFDPTAIAGGGGVVFGGRVEHGVFIHGGNGDGRFKRFRGEGGGTSHGVWVNGGQWAQYNNQAFNSNSYNDWWHDSPRSQPAWVRNNQDCSRPYFQGNVLRC